MTTLVEIEGIAFSRKGPSARSGIGSPHIQQIRPNAPVSPASGLVRAAPLQECQLPARVVVTHDAHDADRGGERGRG